MSLRDKVVVITGGSRGLGKELGRAFSKERAFVILSSRNQKELEGLALEIPGSLCLTADVTDEGQVKKLADFVVRKFGRINIWINNAGVRIPHGPVEDLNIRRVHQMFEVNFFGAVYGSQSALRQMRRQGSGTVVNIVSTSGLTGRANSSAYAASKWAVHGFTESLRLEAKDSGISVIAVYPGGMRTHFFDEQRPADYEEYMEPNFVAVKILENLKKEFPEEELIIRRNL